MHMTKLRCLLLAGGATIACAGQAQAQSGTAAGTIVRNQAKATYKVNGNEQSASSNISTFVVDRKVNLTLVRDQPDNTSVTPSQNGAYVTFRLTNLTNAKQDFLLDPDQQNLSLGVLPGTDNFDMNGLKAFVDADGDGKYNPEVDKFDYVDGLEADQSVAVFLVADTPANAGTLAFVSMHATVADGDTTGTRGAPLLATDADLLNRENEVDIVFADGDSDGAFPGDTGRNGEARAYGAFEVTATNVELSITKSSRVLSDGISGLSPKALPGALVEYCLVVRNGSLLTAAGDVALTDVIPAETTYQKGTLQVGAPGLLAGCLIDGEPEDDDADDATETDRFRGSFNDDTRTITALIPTLAGGTSVAASFQVRIN